MSNMSDSAILTRYYLFYPLWAWRTDYQILQCISMICRLAVSDHSFLPQPQEPHSCQTDTKLTSYRNGLFLPFSSPCFNTTQLHNFCYFIYCPSHFISLSAYLLFSFTFSFSESNSEEEEKKKNPKVKILRRIYFRKLKTPAKNNSKYFFPLKM